MGFHVSLGECRAWGLGFKLSGGSCQKRHAKNMGSGSHESLNSSFHAVSHSSL